MKTVIINDRLNLSPIKFEKRIKNKGSINYKDDYLYIRTSDIIYCLERKKISHLKASGNYTEIFTSCGQKILSSKTLKYFHSLLNAPIFMRIHQSFLINILQVRQVNLGNGQCKIKMLDGYELPISRSRQAQILAFFQN